jgi:hypothetical protein
MTPLLERSLGCSARVAGVRIARVSYKPGERVTVHYETLVDDRAADVVARAVAGHDLEARARHPQLLGLARRIDGRSPATTPVTYEPTADALFTWLPLDPRLPALAESPSALLRKTGLGEPTRKTESRRLSYKAGRRAVLRLDGHVLKLYGSPLGYEAAAAALRAASAVSGVATPAPEAALPQLRMTVQTAVDGEPVTSLQSAHEAGELLTALHGAEIPGLGPDGQLEVVVRKTALISAVAPRLTSQVVSLARRLGRAQPTPGRLVPSHGDFHSGQLLRAGGGVVVVDLDGLCRATPALDLAEYAAAALDEEGAGLDTAAEVLSALVDGYGAQPEALDWHLAAAILIRASHPFHKQLPGWPQRMEHLVGLAGEALDGR